MADDPAQRKAQTTATFNRLAADYDAAGVGCFVYFGRRLVEVVGITPGQAVLDVATGRAGPDGRVVAIDLAEAMLEAARQEVAARGLSAELRVMDAEQLGFAEATTFRYHDLEQYWRNALGTGERRRLTALDAPQAEQVRRALIERLRLRQRSDGLYVEASALFGLASR